MEGIEKGDPGEPKLATLLEEARSESCGALIFVAVYLTPLLPSPGFARICDPPAERVEDPAKLGMGVRSAHETPP